MENKPPPDRHTRAPLITLLDRRAKPQGHLFVSPFLSLCLELH